MQTELKASLSAIVLSLSLGCGDGAGPQASIAISATVNGVPWHPGGRDAPPPYATLFLGTRALDVGGLYEVDFPYRTEQIVIHLVNVTGPGGFVLGDPSTTSFGLYTVWEGRFTDSTFHTVWYFTSDSTSGTVVVTQLDPATRSVAGTFSFVGQSVDGPRVTVTDGVFSGKYEVNPE